MFLTYSSDHRSSSATSPRQHHHHHILDRASHRISGHHHGHHHQLQHHNTWGGGGDMLQAATFALQASAFASMSSSASGGLDPSNVLSSEQQQYSLPCFSNSYSFPNSPPCSTGEDDTLTANPNNPHICVTNVIGDEVLLLGGGKSTPSSSAVVSTTESTSSILSVPTNERGGEIVSNLPSSNIPRTSVLPYSKAQEEEPMDMDEDS